MARREQIGIKLDPAFVARIDQYRQTLEWPVSRTAVIEKAIFEYLERHAPPPPAPPKRPARKGLEASAAL